MELMQLRYFATVARLGNISRAAQELYVTQPNLSKSIARLEEELGVPLFEKNGRSISLTQYGEQFLACAQETLSILDEGVESLQRVSRGEGLIRLGLLRTLGVDYVPKLAARFLAENPGKDIRFTFHTGVTSHLLDELAEKKVDLVFSSKPPVEMGLTAIAVEQQDLVLIVPKNHPLAKNHSVDLTETLPYPQVYFSEGSGMRGVVEELFSKIDGKPVIAYETEEDQVVAGLVAAGFGIAVVPYMDMLLRLDVKIIQIAHPLWERSFYLVSDDRAYQPPAVQKFRQFVLNGGTL